MSGFNYEKDANGVVTVTMDMAGPVNSMSEAFLPALQDTVEKYANDELVAPRATTRSTTR